MALSQETLISVRSSYRVFIFTPGDSQLNRPFSLLQGIQTSLCIVIKLVKRVSENHQAASVCDSQHIHEVVTSPPKASKLELIKVTCAAVRQIFSSLSVITCMFTVHIFPVNLSQKIVVQNESVFGVLAVLNWTVGLELAQNQSCT